MKIVVMGSGGVGGYFGARLAAAGEDVGFVARGAHLEAMKRDGLRIESTAGDLTLKPVKVTSNAADYGSADLVMIAVKLGATQSAIDAVRPLVEKGADVVSFQNGVGAIEALTKAFPAKQVLGGVVHIATSIGAPGVIKHVGQMERLTIGEINGGLSDRVTTFVEIAKKAKINAIASDNIKRVIWDKFVFLSTFSGMTTLLRSPKGPIFKDPDTRRLFIEALNEACAVARAHGVALPVDHEAKTMAFADGLPAEMKASMLHDLERGNPLEVEYLSGAVSRLGKEAGIATPVHSFIATALKLQAGGQKASA
jgi:2-dehydropantoate 2-reductase